MRSIVYAVAASLDGFIAGPKGEYDWIVQDPAIDFAALWDRFDTLLMGRRTFEVALTRFESIEKMGKKLVVVSTTLNPAKHPAVTVLGADFAQKVAALKNEKGKGIWLMGGGALFRGMLDAGLVDSVEVAVMPVLLGSGVPFVPPGARMRLALDECTTTPMGILCTRYLAILPQDVPHKGDGRA